MNLRIYVIYLILLILVVGAVAAGCFGYWIIAVILGLLAAGYGWILTHAWSP